MEMRLTVLVSFVALGLGLSAAERHLGEETWPFLTIRDAASAALAPERFREFLAINARHPGSADEYWMGGFRIAFTPEQHKAFAAKISAGADIPTSFGKYDTEADALLTKTAKEGTLTSLWNGAAKIDSVQGKFMAEAKSADIVNASKVIDGAFKSLIAEAGKAANAPVDKGRDELKATIGKKREALNAAIAACRLEARLLMKSGAILNTVKKAAAAKK